MKPILFTTHRRNHEPTEAQKRAGNYRVTRRRWQGMDISIETRAGELRSGTDRNGRRWEVRLPYDYGYLRGTLGVDGDHFDCFLGPDPEGAPLVHVITTKVSGDWQRDDEQKAMIGFGSAEEAKAAFLASYTDPRFFGRLDSLPLSAFLEKVQTTRERPRLIKALLLFRRR